MSKRETKKETESTKAQTETAKTESANTEKMIIESVADYARTEFVDSLESEKNAYRKANNINKNYDTFFQRGCGLMEGDVFCVSCEKHGTKKYIINEKAYYADSVVCDILRFGKVIKHFQLNRKYLKSIAYSKSDLTKVAKADFKKIIISYENLVSQHNIEFKHIAQLMDVMSENDIIQMLFAENTAIRVHFVESVYTQDGKDTTIKFPVFELLDKTFDEVLSEL